MPLESREDGEIRSAGPNTRPIVIYGRRGPSNPSPDDEVDEYWINDYWFCPEFFDVEFVGENEKWGQDFIEGEMGALKRHLLHIALFNKPTIDIEPFSLYVCIENLQRYYKKKIKELECQKTNTTSSMPESTTETQ